jgi:hypothetical protein
MRRNREIIRKLFPDKKMVEIARKHAVFVGRRFLTLKDYGNFEAHRMSSFRMACRSSLSARVTRTLQV